MPRRGENIYKRKDNRWEGRIRIHAAGNKAIKYKSVYGKTYRDVKQRMTELKNEELMQTHKQEPGNKMFADHAREWLSIQQYKSKESTYAKYYNVLERHIIPEIGDLRPEQLEEARLIAFIQRKMEDGRLDGKGGLSAKTIKDMLCVLKAVLRRIAKMENLPGLSSMDLHPPREDKKKFRILSESELNRLEKNLMIEKTRCKTGILICLYTGIRIGELCALQWRDIDLDTGIIHVRKTMQRIQVSNSPSSVRKTKVLVTPPKSESSVRDIPLPEFLTAELEYWNNENPAAYLLTGESSRYMEPRTVQYQFADLMAELDIQGVTFHSIRHTFASRCVRNYFDIKSLSEILGHATVNITLNRYVHTTMEQKAEQMRQLERLYMKP